MKDEEYRGTGRKKYLALCPIYQSLVRAACQNIPRKPSGKMTQAALALTGMAVLARTHSKLESIFPSVDVPVGQRPGAGQEMAKYKSNG